MRRLMSHRAVSGAIAMAVALGAARAAATDAGSDISTSDASQSGEASCVDAHVQAQKQRAKLELVQARDSLTACAQAHCPGPVRQDCLEWHQEVTVSIPSFVVSATAAGKEIPAATLYVDGELLQPGLDGSAIELNPGPHVVRVVAEGYREAAVTLTARQGQKNRLVQLELKPTEAPGPQSKSARSATRALTVHAIPPPKPRPTHGGSQGWVWGSALVAAAAGGVAISSYLDARARFADAESCRPFCGSSVTDPIRTRLTLATVAGAISVGALGVAGGVWLFDSPSTGGVITASGAMVKLGRRF